MRKTWWEHYGAAVKFIAVIFLILLIGELF